MPLFCGSQRANGWARRVRADRPLSQRPHGSCGGSSFGFGQKLNQTDSFANDRLLVSDGPDMLAGLGFDIDGILEETQQTRQVGPDGRFVGPEPGFLAWITISQLAGANRLADPADNLGK